MALRMALVLLLMALFGVAIVFSFVAGGGRELATWPAILEHTWLVVYLVQVLVVGLALYWIARLLRHRISGHDLAGIVLASWLGLLVVLFTGVVPLPPGPADPSSFWVILTGGPILPFAAIVGGLLGLRR